jgi:hypothetical protein
MYASRCSRVSWAKVSSVGVCFDQPGDKLPHGEVDVVDGSWPIGRAARRQEAFNDRLHPGLAHRPPAPEWTVIPTWLGGGLPDVVEHDPQGMDVGEVILVSQAPVARHRAMEQRHVRSISELPHCSTSASTCVSLIAATWGSPACSTMRLTAQKMDWRAELRT